MSESCPTLVHLVALRRQDGGLPNPVKTADLRFHATPSDAREQLDALPWDVGGSFGVFDATLTVLGEHGAPGAGSFTPRGPTGSEATVNGFEASLLLHLLWDYWEALASGERTAIRGFERIESLAPLAARLERAAEEPREATAPVDLVEVPPGLDPAGAIKLRTFAKHGLGKVDPATVDRYAAWLGKPCAAAA